MECTLGDDGMYYLDSDYMSVLCDNTCAPYPSDVNEDIPYGGRQYTQEDEDDWNLVDEDDPRNLRANLSEIKKEDEWAVVSKIAAKRFIASDTNMLYDIHRRWGHLGEDRIKLAIRNKLIDTDIDYEKIVNLKMPLCPDCLRGRMQATRSTASTNHDWKTFEKIGCDYKGPIRVLASGKYTGFYLFSDYASHYVWAYPVRRKDDLLGILQVFLVEQIKRVGGTMKVLQVDMDSVSVGKRVANWLYKEGIKIQVSPPYQKNQNGQVERDMQNVLSRTRTCMASFNTPPKFWDYAVCAACWYINRSPSSRSDNATPLFTAYQRLPKLEDMNEFYILGVYHLTTSERGDAGDGVFGDRGRMCRLLGYEELIRGDDKLFIILDLKTKRIIKRSNVIFDRNFVEEYLEEQREYLEKENDTGDEVSENSDEVFPRPPENLGFDEQLDPNDDQYNEEEDKDFYGNYWNASVTNTSEDVYDYSNYQNIMSLDANSGKYLSTVGYYHSELERPFMCNEVNIAGKNSELKKIVLPPAPKNLTEALNGPDKVKWWDAVYKELETLENYGTFEKADQEGHAMKTKLVLTLVFKNDYEIKYKARLVVCGYSQIQGRDYSETFAPTTSVCIVFLLLALAANRGYVFKGFDVTAAFLEGYNDYIQYCRLPKELGEELGGLRCRIRKSLYGEKQAPKIWNDRINEIFVDLMGFVRCPVEPCLYKKEVGVRGEPGYRFLFITIHVDDGLMIASDDLICEVFYEEFEKHIRKVSRFDPVEKYLGMDIYKDGDHIVVHQETYVLNKMKDLVECKKAAKVPMSNSCDLKKAAQNAENESLLPVTGKLRYVCDRTRPDLLLSVGEISSGGSPHPSDAHVQVSEQIVKYLRTTLDRRLRLGGPGPFKLFGFCDASYITSGDSKGRLGGAIFTGLYSGAVYSFCKKDDTVSHSSMEIEIKSLDLLIRVLLFILDMMEFIGEEPTEPTTIYCDNKSAIELCKTLKQHHKVKHINMRINFIREMINKRRIQLVFVPTEYNVADMLTKPLGPELFNSHQRKLLHGFNGELDFNPTVSGVTYELVLNHIAAVDYLQASVQRGKRGPTAGR
jgi:hypothetical protein